MQKVPHVPRAELVQWQRKPAKEERRAIGKGGEGRAQNVENLREGVREKPAEGGERGDRALVRREFGRMEGKHGILRWGGKIIPKYCGRGQDSTKFARQM